MVHIFTELDKDATLEEVLEVDPERLEIVCDVNDETVKRLKTFFGDMSRLPKRICFYLPDGFEKMRKNRNAKEDIEELLSELQAKTHLLRY